MAKLPTGKYPTGFKSREEYNAYMKTYNAHYREIKAIQREAKKELDRLGIALFPRFGVFLAQHAKDHEVDEIKEKLYKLAEFMGKTQYSLAYYSAAGMWELDNGDGLSLTLTSWVASYERLAYMPTTENLKHENENYETLRSFTEGRVWNLFAQLYTYRDWIISLQLLYEKLDKEKTNNLKKPEVEKE